MTSATIETTLRKALQSKGMSNASIRSLGNMIRIAEKIGLFTSDDIHLLRRISIYRNDAIHLGKIPDKKTIQGILDITRHLLNAVLEQRVDVKGRKKPKGITKPWKRIPNIQFRVTQNLIDTFYFPQVGWEVYNNSLYQLRMRIEIHPLLGGKDLHPLPDDDINGTNEYEVEPKSFVFSNGCFTLPEECASSNDELILEIRSTVEDINDPKKRKLKLVPRRWKYVRETNAWSYFPQRPRIK
jgi:hypothetical protein